MRVVLLRRPAGGGAGRDESLGSMKQRYEGKDLQGLVDLGHDQGYLTFDQVNDFLSQDVASPTDLRAALESFEDMDIKVLEEFAGPAPHRRRRIPRRRSARTRREPNRRTYRRPPEMATNKVRSQRGAQLLRRRASFFFLWDLACETWRQPPTVYPSAGDRPKPQVPIAGAAPEHRSVGLRLAVPMLPGHSECDHGGQARDRYPVSDRRLSAQLDGAAPARLHAAENSAPIAAA
jgi:hypothetical protein